MNPGKSSTRPSSLPSEAKAPCTDPGLELTGFGVAFGDRVVLDEVSASLPARGLTVLVGPSGGGKSTLVRTLSGLNDNHPSLETWGEVRSAGEPWPSNGQRHAAPTARRPTLVVQHARFFLDTVAENLIGGLPNRAAHERSAQLRIVREALEARGLGHLGSALEREAVSLPLAEQRCLSVLRAALAGPAVLFTDEPTAGLDDAGAEAVVRLLRSLATERSVLFVTHHQRWARFAGGTTWLLSNGKIQEETPTSRFFTAPQTELGRQFLATGSCPTSSPAPRGAPRSEPPPEPEARRAHPVKPRGFSWIIPDKLGGLPRPGVIDDLDGDLRGLETLGVTLLVTLEEPRTVDEERLAALGIRSVHFPIPDMKAPELTETLKLCERVEGWLAAGHRVAYHCLAGHGRTGTLLACQLVFGGLSARLSLEQVRAVNPRYVQSDVQVAFLRSVELAVAERAGRDPSLSTLALGNELTTTRKGSQCH